MKYRAQYVHIRNAADAEAKLQQALDANQRKVVAVVPYGMAGLLLIREAKRSEQ